MLSCTPRCPGSTSLKAVMLVPPYLKSSSSTRCRSSEVRKYVWYAVIMPT